ncbi:MAG TPA: tetraacyldisaccharide 4'-kinase [Ignavibacteria bacterium]|nr:tetraacyldisaccharide 4'-kinase [Ignavibacteria bacterium]
MKNLRIILFPFSFLYWLIILFRKLLYNAGFLSKYHSNKKIISIGNINTGGTGKTPFTIFVSKYFLSQGKTIGILSRGYGRKEKGFNIVYNNGLAGDITNSGDELIMIAYNLEKEFKKKIIIIADDNKKNGIKYLEKENVDLIILDDGFQSDYINKDLEIVLIDTEEMISNRIQDNLLLPAGNLRVPKSYLKNADIIIQNNKSKNYSSLKSEYVVCEYISENIYDYNNKIIDLKDKKVIAVSAIAKPNSFLNSINRIGIIPIKSINYKDHFDYSKIQLNELLNKFNPEFIITTEKDMVKIIEIISEEEKNKFCYLKLELKVSINEDILLKQLNKFV